MSTIAVQSPVISPTLEFALRRPLSWGHRPLVMGVLNLTPDSFSDGGRWTDPAVAIDRAQAMVDEGADLLDIGAESTRPGGGVYGDGADFVPSAEEIRRLLPVLEQVRDHVSVPISVDTRKAEVAHAALAAGADLINDISALGDPEMAHVIREAHCPLILMHSRGRLESMQREISFADVVGEVLSELSDSLTKADDAGIPRESLWVDPGIGFGKTGRQNLQILRDLDRFHSLGRPVVVGASRKSFLGEVTGEAVSDRLPGSLAAAGWAARHRAAVVRAHDVRETCQYLRVWQAIDAVEESAG